MLCEFCGKDMEDLYLLTLPCGYVVCHNHLKIQDTKFNCLVCQDHFIETKICYEMRKNRTKLKKMEFFEKKKILFRAFEIIDELTQRRKYLLAQFEKKIDDHYLILKESLEREESCFLYYIKLSLENIDTAEIRKNLNFDSYLNLNPRDEFFYFSETNNYFSDINTKKIGELLQLSENLKQFKCELNSDIQDLDESKFFGKYNQPILPCTSNQYLKPFLRQFVSICQIRLQKFEELSSGHLVAVDSSNSTLIKINPLNGELNEISKFKISLFFSNDDQIVTISEDNFITIWKED
ncbi:hypothetical protein BpHYR1_034743 [Brachionus plicatilis]|uniref:Uncharacterized protein n=1 Tax=Brachionus plicatilis TaxID=10195 RepID=A0A3M7RS59_BRAPC|nr:hypothetical protein BpHYR1_034743 [Brachionus plicatilis]